MNPVHNTPSYSSRIHYDILKQRMQKKCMFSYT
jgi:hypothetical protein